MLLLFFQESTIGDSFFVSYKVWNMIPKKTKINISLTASCYLKTIFGTN